MPATAHVDPATGIAQYSATGELTRDEILAVIEQVYRDPGYRAPWRSLWEMIGATPVLSGDELRAVVAYVKNHRPANTGKIAIVATKDVAFGMARMFELAASNQHLEARVFRDLELARQWLLEDEAETS
jgi:hypothetical protein